MTLKLRGHNITSASIKNDGISILVLIIFNIFIFIYTFASIFVLTLSINKLFGQFIKIYFEA